MRNRWLLVLTLVTSTSAFLLVSGWLLSSPGVAKADALKTGGLAGGAVLALYALWINDRRRRTEEARHEVERDRAQQDRDRISDERFAKAVELLGNDPDQVRVGAMHVLAGLARARPDYTQTVLDVLCSYLRRPFTHPSYQARPDNPDQAAVAPDAAWSAEALEAADRERQVRLTAQRLIADLLPPSTATEPVRHDLDLTSASLEYLDLTGRRLGRLTARRAQLYGISRLTGLRVAGPALFSDATLRGRAKLDAASFDGGLSLSHARIRGEWQVRGATVRRFIDLRAAAPGQQSGTLTLVGDALVKRDAESDWVLEQSGEHAPDRPRRSDFTAVER